MPGIIHRARRFSLEEFQNHLIQSYLDVVDSKTLSLEFWNLPGLQDGNRPSRVERDSILKVSSLVTDSPNCRLMLQQRWKQYF